MVAIILPTDPSLTLLFGSKGQNSTFSEHGHVANQIKGNHQMQQHGSKYVARIPLPDPEEWSQKVKLQPFQNMVILHIKLMGITKCSSNVANILPSDPYLTLGMGSIDHNETILEDGHVACQIKGLTECSSMVANILPDPGDWVNGSKFNFFITWSCCILN